MLESACGMSEISVGLQELREDRGDSATRNEGTFHESNYRYMEEQWGDVSCIGMRREFVLAVSWTSTIHGHHLVERVFWFLQTSHRQAIEMNLVDEGIERERLDCTVGGIAPYARESLWS